MVLCVCVSVSACVCVCVCVCARTLVSNSVSWHHSHSPTGDLGSQRGHVSGLLLDILLSFLKYCQERTYRCVSVHTQHCPCRLELGFKLLTSLLPSLSG